MNGIASSNAVDTSLNKLQAVLAENGPGLTLYVAHCLVEAMGGTVGVMRKLGQGSTFWLELPSALPAK